MVELITSFPDAPHHGQEFPGDRMSGIAGDYAIFHHPFIISFEYILFLVYCRQGGAEDGVFEDAISGPWQLQSCGFCFAVFIGSAGSSLQAYAAVFPQFILSAEPPGSIEIGKDGGGTDNSDAGEFFPEADYGMFSGEID